MVGEASGVRAKEVGTPGALPPQKSGEVLRGDETFEVDFGKNSKRFASNNARPVGRGVQTG